MTREEAFKLLKNNNIYYDIEAYKFIAALDALGLIKFDEPKPMDFLEQAKDYLAGKTSKYNLNDMIEGLVEKIESKELSELDKSNIKKVYGDTLFNYLDAHNLKVIQK